MLKTFWILLAFLLLAATPVLAEKGQKGDWELGPYGGIGYPDQFGDANPQDGWLYGARFGYFTTDAWSIEGSIQRFDSKTDFDPSLGQENVDFNLRSYRLNVLYNFLPGKSFRPFATVGAGREIFGSSVGGESVLGYNLGGGVRFYHGKYFGIRLDGRLDSLKPDFVQDRQSDIEVTLGLLWSFGGAAAAAPPDSDKDGVPDKKDKCPDTPAGARVDERGCPVDTDGDGVPDGIDACPNSPAGQKVDATGCPPDSDHDGVTDDKDKCPNTPEGASVDERGCPRDSDGDGVYDYQDRCPNTPAGTEVDANGCPIPPPAPPPPPPPAVFNGVLEGVSFDSGTARLTAGAKSALDNVAQTLKEWPDVKVEIEGHTDSQGNDAFNQKLSQARAESVKTYLVGKGVDASRLTAHGYGEAKPVADNATAEGRAKNRRVELARVP